MAGPELLVFVRHAHPIVEPAEPPPQWALSAEGIAGAQRMAERLASVGVRLTRVVSSIETKAVETGRAVADRLGIAFQTGHDLHEHERDEFVADRAELESLVQRFFARPDERVYGVTSAAATERRFSAAVDAIVRVYKDERLCIVTHGLVLCLHLAARFGVDAYDMHRRLGMPACVVVDRRTHTVVDVIDSV